MKPTLTLTPAAIETVLKINPNYETVLRIGVRGGGCSGFEYAMNFEDQDSIDPLNDTVFTFGENTEDAGPVRVVVDQKSMIYLNGIEIGHHSNLQSSGFTFKNPNAKSGCGCGKSFGA